MWLILVVLFFLGMIDWYYHYNSLISIIRGLCGRQRPITDTFSIHRMSSVCNIDSTFSHVNNAKFLMYMDFAREDFWCRTRLSSFLFKVRAFPLQSGTIIRYMTPIPIFTRIRIDTKLVWWDNRMLYLEHRFVIKRTERVAAVSISRVCFENHDMEKALEKFPGGDQKMEYPERLRGWIEALSQSSKELMRSPTTTTE